MQTKYEEVADFVVSLVDCGALRMGMRAPSLRTIARDREASMSTVLQAYRLLEDRGVLEARPKSGFYVASHGRVNLPAPITSQPPKRPSNVTITGHVTELLERAANPELVPLGCAIPNADLLAAGRLDKFMARAARTHGHQYNIYTEPRGLLSLREEICRRVVRWGQALSPDDVLLTIGCTEALSLSLQALARRGDTVAIESPTYFGILQVLESLGLRVLELPTSPARGIEPDALDAALKARRVSACLFSSSFNNPLGHAMPDCQRREILDILAKHDVPLIEDDIYGDIYFGKERPKPFMAMGSDADVIYCNSFSKTIAPGYRVGWIVARQHMSDILAKKFAQTLCGPALPQAALAEFLECGGYDSHLRRMRRVFADHIDRMTRAIDRHFPDGTKVTRPAGGFVLWVELPEACNSREVFHTALEQGICIAPGDMFSASDRYKHCIRLSCGEAWSERIERSIATLGSLIRSLC